MTEGLRKAILNYGFKVEKFEPLNEDGDVFKLTDGFGCDYFLKLYGANNDYDYCAGERVYHTREQIRLEAEILLLLSEGDLKTAKPVANKNGGFVTELEPETEGEPEFAAVTSYVEGKILNLSEKPSKETAYVSGVAAAALHLESNNKLLPLAVKRPHKRQEYINKMREYLKRGISAGTLAAAQYEMLCGCCGEIIRCMDALDGDVERNVGLVHTDIINGNVAFSQSRATLLDFSRSVYSYYLYDLAEMCFHSNFGGSSLELQREILRGYHSVKPLEKYDFFAMQALFAMFIMTIFCVCVDTKQNAWMENTLKWFETEVHPGLISGKGFVDSSVFKGIA